MGNRELWNNGWSFCKTALGTSLEVGLKEKFNPVNLPHDWLIYQGQALYEDGVGFYKKNFLLDKDISSRYEIYFEGVYMDSTVYVNGTFVGEWKYGYSSFFFDITDSLVSGENEIVVRVNHQSPNSRWYSGAGIYRNVWFITQPQTHFITDSLYIAPKSAVVTGVKKGDDATELLNIDWEKLSTKKAYLENSKLDPERIEEITSGQPWMVHISIEAVLCAAPEDLSLNIECHEAGISKLFEPGDFLWENASDGALKLSTWIRIEEPTLWCLYDPFMYNIRISLLGKDGQVLDFCESRFGLRQLSFDSNKGFFLNGEHVKIQGVCEHHDLGALGAAFNESAMRRKLEILRDMGVNAIRTAHNMPAPALLNLTDEMGFLVFDESFDVWEISKTEYDYARYFNEWQSSDIRNWIRRDRNHPSIIFWSIGNEIPDTHASERGPEITRMLQSEVASLDYEGNAAISLGSNYMPWEGAQKCADILKFAGYNYAERLYDEHHEAHPDWFIFGSETSSTLQSRGIYHFPYSQPGLAEVDEQCSCLGNCTASWGAKNTEYNIFMDRDREYCLGQFVWSGFDYIGEPTPYQTRNSYFGQVDTAGFPKDTYYLYKAAWTDYRVRPFVHIFPYWDFNPGQLIDVRVASNAPFVKLFVNGREWGSEELSQKMGTKLTGDFTVPYEEGTITAIAYDNEGNEIAHDSRSSFGDPVSLKLEQYKPSRELVAGAGDMTFVSITAVDEKGNVVETANSLVMVEVTGCGWLAGLDNGDSTDLEEYKGNRKRLFGGRLLALVAVGEDSGEIRIKATLEPKDQNGAKSISLMRILVPFHKFSTGLSLLPENLGDGRATLAVGGKAPKSTLDGKNWVRKLSLAPVQGQRFTPDIQEIQIDARIYPLVAYGDYCDEIFWAVVTNSGITSPLAKVVKTEKTYIGSRATVKAYGDGNFRVRCMCKNGTDVVKVISELEFTAEGLGQANLNPYELIPGAMYSRTTRELGNGVQHGVCPGPGRTVITFDRVDFGGFGSDEITVPIFSMENKPLTYEVWEGVPGEEEAEDENATKLAEAIYQKESIWEVYQGDAIKLNKRLKGITTVSLVFYDRINVAGFSFTAPDKAFSELLGSDRDSIYGDSFREEGTAIFDIGNNVSIEYGDMDFGEDGARRITITGHTPKDRNTIHVVFGEVADNNRAILEFEGYEDVVSQSFEIAPVRGLQTVRLVFLPGSKFDLHSFRFEK